MGAWVSGVPGVDVDLGAIRAFVAAVEATGAHAALSDAARLELEGDAKPGGHVVVDPEKGVLGYVHVRRVRDDERRWEAHVVTAAEHRRGEVAARLLQAARDDVEVAGGGRLAVWAFRASPDDDRFAHELGFHPARDLLQMRRPMPHSEPPAPPAGVTFRSFRPGHDDEGWLVVNNRAFAGHPDQGKWTLDDLRKRMSEPWFDAEGFVVAEAEGAIVGSCWTKVHSGDLGEIYVIAADPAWHGRGLGRALVLTGLERLATRGVDVAMLYTEASNESALRLYRDLGFTVDHGDRMYEAVVGGPERADARDQESSVEGSVESAGAAARE